MSEVTGRTLKQAVLDHVDLSARLMTDELNTYTTVGKMFEGGHDRIKHSRKIYVRGDITTNTVESFFAILKRDQWCVPLSVSGAPTAVSGRV